MANPNVPNSRNMISVEGNVFPVREGERPSAKYWQPPPRIRITLGRFGLVDLLIEEAQSLHNQLQNALAQAERERMKKDESHKHGSDIP